MILPHTHMPVRSVIPHTLTRPHTSITDGVCVAKNGRFLWVSVPFYTLLTHLGYNYHMEKVKTADFRRFCHIHKKAVGSFGVGSVRPHP